MVTIDRYYATGSTEYKSRNGKKITTLQLHHMAGRSLSVLLDLMQPGGRRVSANFALSAEGVLVNVVPLNMRAFTSASQFDEECYTVETVNSGGSPLWAISEAAHRRAAKLLAEMHVELGVGLFYGRGGVIGHRDVPGTYATSCPGPSMNFNQIITWAKELVTTWGGNVPASPKPTQPAIVVPVASSTVKQGERGDRAKWVLDRLKAHGYYKGYINDKHLGPIGVRHLKAFQGANGLRVDGYLEWGPGHQTYDALAANPKSSGGSKPAPAGLKLNLKEDGKRGPQTIGGLQKYLNSKNIKVDGNRIKEDERWGPQTAEGLQILIGAHPDGNFAEQSTTRLQNRLRELDIRVAGFGKSDKIYNDGQWPAGNPERVTQTTWGLQKALNRGIL